MIAPVPGTEAPLADDPRSWPAVLTLQQAAEVLRIGRTTAYALARSGQFPVPALRVGIQWRVPRIGIEAFLAGPARVSDAEGAD